MINLQTITQDPLLMGGIIVILGAAVMYQKRQDSSVYEKINPETMKERLQSIFTEPTRKRGGAVSDWVKMQGTSNTPRTIGLAVYAKDHSVQRLNVQDLNEESNSDKFDDLDEVEGTTYEIIEGSKKINVLPKYYTMKYLKLSFLYDRFLETYDTPANRIVPGEDYIYFRPGTLFVKYNGVKRVATFEGMSRVQDLSFSKMFENYLEAMQNIPEQLSTLNNRISGDIKLENIRSENIKEYMESKDRSGKRNAMND